MDNSQKNNRWKEIDVFLVFVIGYFTGALAALIAWGF